MVKPVVLVTVEPRAKFLLSLKFLEGVTLGYVSGFIVHHHVAPDRLTGGHLICGEIEEHGHFHRSDRFGPAPPVPAAEHQLVVERPPGEHGRIDENHPRIDSQILKNIGNTKLAILQTPGRSDPEIAQPDREDVPHQIEVSGPEQKRENRVQEPQRTAPARAGPYDVILYDGRIPRSGLTQAARKLRRFARALGKPTTVVAAMIIQ